MRLYELWKHERKSGRLLRLEDEGGPVLFLRPNDALMQTRAAYDSEEAEFAVIEVRVGTA
jgi:hypothetical protein